MKGKWRYILMATLVLFFAAGGIYSYCALASSLSIDKLDDASVPQLLGAALNRDSLSYTGIIWARFYNNVSALGAAANDDESLETTEAAVLDIFESLTGDDGTQVLANGLDPSFYLTVEQPVSVQDVMNFYAPESRIVKIYIKYENITDMVGLSLTLNYDQTKLEPVSVVRAAGLPVTYPTGDPQFPESYIFKIEQNEGKINIAWVTQYIESPEPGEEKETYPPASGIFGIVTFQIIGQGITTLELSDLSVFAAAMDGEDHILVSVDSTTRTVNLEVYSRPTRP